MTSTIVTSLLPTGSSSGRTNARYAKRNVPSVPVVRTQASVATVVSGPRGPSRQSLWLKPHTSYALLPFQHATPLRGSVASTPIPTVALAVNCRHWLGLVEDATSSRNTGDADAAVRTGT